MKKMLILLVAILGFATLGHSQNEGDVFSVQAGYSWTMGMVGVQYQNQHLGIGAGVLSVSEVPSYSAFAIATLNKPYESGLYCSVGFISSAYRGEEIVDGVLDEDFTSPMGAVNVGYMYHWDSGFNIKGELGYGFCKYEKKMMFGVSAGWAFSL